MECDRRDEHKETACKWHSRLCDLNAPSMEFGLRGGFMGTPWLLLDYFSFSITQASISCSLFSPSHSPQHILRWTQSAFKTASSCSFRTGVRAPGAPSPGRGPALGPLGGTSEKYYFWKKFFSRKFDCSGTNWLFIAPSLHDNTVFGNRFSAASDYISLPLLSNLPPNIRLERLLGK